MKHIEAIYSKLKNDEKSLLLDGIALSDTYLDAIFTWLEQEPENYLANLFSGVANTYVAWQIRTGQLAEDVKREQFQGFFKNLTIANQQVRKTALLAPKDPEAYSRLIRISMGLQDTDEAFNNFNQLLTIDPEHLGGHMFMFNFLTPKWFGSNEEMRDFAIKFKEKQESSLLNIIYLMLAAEDFHVIEEEDYEKAVTMLKKHHRKAIMSLYAQIDISSIPSYQRYFFHNYFSYLFHFLGKTALRDKEMKLMGKNLSFYPWAYRGVEGIKEAMLFRLTY